MSAAVEYQSAAGITVPSSIVWSSKSYTTVGCNPTTTLIVAWMSLSLYLHLIVPYKVFPSDDVNLLSLNVPIDKSLGCLLASVTFSVVQIKSPST